MKELDLSPAMVAVYDQRRCFASRMWKRLAVFLETRVPITVYNRCKEERDVIAFQLSQRRDFPYAEWHSLGVDIDRVEVTLKLLAEELGWINHHFLPGDTFALLFTPGYYEFQANDMWLELDRQLGIRVSDDRAEELMMSKTLGDFVTGLLLPRNSRDTAAGS